MSIEHISNMHWEFGREIITETNLEHAELYLKHCLLAGYKGVYKQELLELRDSINNFLKNKK